MPKDPYKDIIPRLSAEELKALIKSLPEPDVTMMIGTNERVRFEIYIAKRIHSTSWTHPVLADLVLHARGTFYAYSKLPPLDNYDPKSQIYLVRGCYGSMEEWFSMRFVPYDGHPPKFRDLEMFEYRGRDIEYWIKKRLLDPKKLALINTIGGSGNCGIEPFVSGNHIESSVLLPRNLRYASVEFALAVKHFATTCSAGGRTYSYLIGQLPEEFVQNVLTFKINGREFRPNCTLASEMLGIKDDAQVKLKRDNPLIYTRPLYFLNRKKFIEFLANLLKSEILTVATFDYYLGNSVLASKLLNDEKIAVDEFSEIGKLLIVEGAIHGAKISGAKLRALLKAVPDGPRLRILELRDFCDSLQRIIDAADDLI